MLTRKTDIPLRSAHSLGLLVLIVFLAAIFCSLPCSHHLFHDSLVEPEHCPAHLLQSALSLLFGGLVLAFAVLNAPKLGPSAPRTVPLPLFNPRFTCLNRGPPRC